MRAGDRFYSEQHAGMVHHERLKHLAIGMAFAAVALIVLAAVFGS